MFFFSSRRRHTRCALVTGVQTCALPIYPFSATYAVLAKAMDAKTLLQVQAVINAKKDKLTYDEARALAERALDFKRERGRLPSLTSQDAWERKMAEGVARSEEHTSELQSLMRSSYAVFCLKKKKNKQDEN